MNFNLGDLKLIVSNRSKCRTVRQAPLDVSNFKLTMMMVAMVIAVLVCAEAGEVHDPGKSTFSL